MGPSGCWAARGGGVRRTGHRVRRIRAELVLTRISVELVRGNLGIRGRWSQVADLG
jgi:hypothetical protein